MLAPGFSSGADSGAGAALRRAGGDAVADAAASRRDPAASAGRRPDRDVQAIAVELLVGGMIGLLARIFFLALETLAAGAAEMLGFSNPFGMQIEQRIAAAAGDPDLARGGDARLRRRSALGADPWAGRVLRRHSGWGRLQRALALRQVADALGASFQLCLRIASPYVIYALIVNVAMALVNRLTPQVQIFFIATPFIIAGAFALLFFTIKPAIEAFLIGFSAWLSAG